MSSYARTETSTPRNEARRFLIG